MSGKTVHLGGRSKSSQTHPTETHAAAREISASADPLGLIGKRLGGTEIISVLGRGGMAVVYKAYQKGKARHVAVKVLAPTFVDDAHSSERFRREALAGGHLDHPNIVHVYDTGQQGAHRYLVMQLLEGGDLAARLRMSGPMRPEEVSAVLLPIAYALDHAHGYGVIHRDIKPGNILFDANDQPVLSDFGIARLAGSATVTSTGTFIGTPAYVSPEQVNNRTLDARSDVYSLGIVAYEMLTGDVPFKGEPTAVLHAHVYSKPPQPGMLDARVRQVVMRALAKEPDTRFSSAGEFAHAFTEAIATQSVKKPALVLPTNVGMLAAAGSVIAALATVLTMVPRLSGAARGSIVSPSPTPTPRASVVLTAEKAGPTPSTPAGVNLFEGPSMPTVDQELKKRTATVAAVPSIMAATSTLPPSPTASSTATVTPTATATTTPTRMPTDTATRTPTETAAPTVAPPAPTAAPTIDLSRPTPTPHAARPGLTPIVPRPTPPFRP